MKKDCRIIYKPTGPALEYSDLACNIYKGCEHGCRYCFGKGRLSAQQKTDYDSNPNPKAHFLEKLACKAEKLNGNIPEILFSFLGDVYQPAEIELRLTRGALEILNKYNGLPYTILTKGGTRAVRDFDLLEAGRGRFGSTIIFKDQAYADDWEPGAASIKDRIEAIRQAHEQGIPTWVSVEPVIEPDQALQIIQALHPIVDHWKVGKINHWPEIEREHDWLKFKDDVERVLDNLGADYYLKDSLTKLK